MSALKIDKDLLTSFEEGLHPQHPEKSKVPVKILGYGEMSTVFEISVAGHDGYAYKRMPIFKTIDEAAPYEKTYDLYNTLLKESVGIDVPAFDSAVVKTKDGKIVMFDVQKKLLPESIGNRVIGKVSEKEIEVLIKLALREFKKLWAFNAKKKKYELGIDGQISNWSVVGFDPKSPKVTEKDKLLYLDTSTPFLRIDGVEQLDPELFLRAAPSFMVWLIRWLFLKDVMTRYYDFRMVVIDLIANFYKEQRPEMVPKLIDVANDFFGGEGKEFGIKPITEKEVKSYYSEDAMIWRIWLFFRKVDRFIKTKITRKGYPFILPGKIKR